MNAFDHRTWFLLAVGLLLSGCAARAPLPASMPALELPQQLHVQRHAPDTDWLLVIQDDAGALRFSLLDPLGVPLARQRLVQGEWHSEGLLPPNPQARELFAAVLFALTPQDQLARTYPDSRAGAESRTLHQRGHARWQVRHGAARQFDIRMADGLSYRVMPLPAEAAR